jgi:lysophospholipid acyltransferase (LPLAT)-like uncharacterized protein
VTDSRLSASQRVKAGLIAGAGYPLVAALGRTLSWTIEGEEHYHAIIRSGRQPILALWHGGILSATLYWRDRGIVALTSENFDGEWVARLMARFGYRAARGSTSHGGASALGRLRRELAGGHPVAFTVDGPRGPARVARPGAVWLAGAAGHPILPFHAKPGRHWTARSWDAAQIPRPFTTVAMVMSEPIEVGGTSPEVIEGKRAELQQALEAAEAKARALSPGSQPS